MATKKVVKKGASKPPAPKRGRGQPTKYTDAIGKRLCELIASGLSVPKACKTMKLSFYTVVGWSVENESFSSIYARAREVRTETLLEELQEIADVGNTKDRFGGNERARLRVDTRKWIIVKMLPKKYGDKMEHDVKSRLTVVLDKDDSNA